MEAKSPAEFLTKRAVGTGGDVLCRSRQADGTHNSWAEPAIFPTNTSVGVPSGSTEP